MNIDYDAIHAAARRERNLVMQQYLQRYLYAPVAALFRRLVRPEPRKPGAIFPIARGC